MTSEPNPAPGDLERPVCYRHPGREAHIRCQRCGRPICPDCMVPASVGFQCPECVREGSRTTRQGRTTFGGVRPTAPGSVTMALIGLNVVVFLLVLVSGGADSLLLTKLALIPRSTVLLVSGRPEVVQGVANGAWWQLVTSMFTHVQIWHIGFNMLFLYLLGPQLEIMLGRWRYLALYLLSGLTGSVFVYVLAHPASVTVGASGALFGLMAALLVAAVKVRGQVQSLVGLIVVNAVITFLGADYISWQGHLGGFVGGLFLGTTLVYAPRRHRTVWQVAGMVLLAVVLVVAIVLRTAALT
jgi:membrane associated rhomboid family serine protease